MPVVFRAAWFASLLLGCAHQLPPGPAFARVTLVAPSAATTHVVEGRVEDAHGRPLEGVTIVIVGTEGEQAELTDDQGHYRIAGIGPGAHTVAFYYGRAKVMAQIEMVGGQGVRLQVTLEPGPPQESGADLSMIDPSPAVRTTLTQDFLTNIPAAR
jgi:hypothetical protein